MLVIFLIAWKRNDWKTLLEGTFEKDKSTLKSELLDDKNERFSSLMKEEVFSPLKKEVDRESRDTQQGRR